MYCLIEKQFKVLWICVAKILYACLKNILSLEEFYQSNKIKVKEKENTIAYLGQNKSITG